jgi:hypothetical protein
VPAQRFAMGSMVANAMSEMGYRGAGVIAGEGASSSTFW